MHVRPVLITAAIVASAAFGAAVPLAATAASANPVAHSQWQRALADTATPETAGPSSVVWD
jgi:hypothetical protein